MMVSVVSGLLVAAAAVKVELRAGQEVIEAAQEVTVWTLVVRSVIVVTPPAPWDAPVMRGVEVDDVDDDDVVAVVCLEEAAAAVWVVACVV